MSSHRGPQPAFRTATGRSALGVLCAALLILVLAAPAAAHRQVDEFEFGEYDKWDRPLQGLVIALDPRHNGGNIDAAAVINERISDGRGGWHVCDSVGNSTRSGYPAHELTFDVAERLADELEHLGAQVRATRTDNTGAGPCADVRGRFAEDNDADLMVSIGAGGSRATEASGFAVLIADPPLSTSQGEPSRELAEAMAAGLARNGFEPDPRTEAGISTREDVATLNFARRPAALVLLGQMRHQPEAELMKSAQGRAAYAEALAEGVLDWAGRDD